MDVDVEVREVERLHRAFQASGQGRTALSAWQSTGIAQNPKVGSGICKLGRGPFTGTSWILSLGQANAQPGPRHQTDRGSAYLGTVRRWRVVQDPAGRLWTRPERSARPATEANSAGPSGG